jgi:hypothetical protein
MDLFFVGFTIYYTVNALFFNDSTMHKIYVDEGSYNFINKKKIIKSKTLEKEIKIKYLQKKVPIHFLQIIVIKCLIHN